MKKIKVTLMEGIRKRFTLIELIVVIVILGILAAIVVPNISTIKEEAIPVAVSNNERALQTAIDMYGLDHNGKLPTVLNPTIENPQPPDYSVLYPDYIRSKPEVGHYLIDVFGKVWGSTSIAPYQMNYIAGEFSFKAVDTATEYELLEYGETKEINTTAGGAVGKYKIKTFAQLPLEEQEAKGIYRVENPENKNLLVSAIDKYGLKAAPVGEDHLGIVEGLPVKGTKTFYLITDAKGEAVWEGIQRHEILPEGTSIEYSFATSDDGKNFGSTFTQDIGTLDSSRYLKVKVDMKSENDNEPILEYLKVIYHLVEHKDYVKVQTPLTPIVLGATEKEQTFTEVIDLGSVQDIGVVDYSGREKIKLSYQSSTDGITYSPSTPYLEEVTKGRYLKITANVERKEISLHSPTIEKIVVNNAPKVKQDTGFVAVPPVESPTGDESSGTTPTEPTPITKVNHVQVGHYIEYGRHYDGKPIRWQVAKIESGKAMISMEEPLRDANGKFMVKPFDLGPNAGEPTDVWRTERGSNNWATSDIRQWLNNDFYNEAFSHQEIIQSTSIDYAIPNIDKSQATSGSEAHENEIWGTGYENYATAFKGTTVDKIYYLNVEELEFLMRPLHNAAYAPDSSFIYTLRDAFVLNTHQVRTRHSSSETRTTDANHTLLTDSLENESTAILAAMNVETSLFQYGDGSKLNPYRIEKMKENGYIEYGTFNGKPILWQAVKEEGDNYMLFASAALKNSDGTVYRRPFDAAFYGGTSRESLGVNDWELSDIRSWLNGDFANLLPDNQSLVSKSNDYLLHSTDAAKATSGTVAYWHPVSRSQIVTNYTNSYKNTVTDKVSLPSIYEVYDILHPAIGSLHIYDGDYLLRDSSEYGPSYSYQLIKGYNSSTVSQPDNQYSFADGGVRPVIYINKSKVNHGDGTFGTKNKPYQLK